MERREVRVKSALTRTKIGGYDYCVNPYVGCEHGCLYCYATFMRRFTGHHEPWGEFLDIKTNAPEVLRRQLRRTAPGTVLVGTVTDPYQPAEKDWKVTRGCLEALLERQVPVHLLTRSPLCLRDVDLFRQFHDIEVGLSITTDREEMRKLFEPRAPSIRLRITALRGLHAEGVKTYAFIGPMLPLDPLRLFRMLEGSVDSVMVDRMNYSHKVLGLYQRNGLEHCLESDYFVSTAAILRERFATAGISTEVIF
jgi:DNA repair photolyase